MKGKNKFPTVKGHWLLKNAPMLKKDSLGFLMSQYKKLGATYEAPVPFTRLIVTSDPEFMDYVLRDKDNKYIKSNGWKEIKIAIGDGLASSNGCPWKKQRELIQPVFGKNNLKKLFPIMAETVNTYLDKMMNLSGKTIDMANQMTIVTSKVVMGTLCSDKTTSVDHLYKTVADIQRYLFSRINNPLFKPITYINGSHQTFKKDLKILDDFIYGLIDKRRNSKETHYDLLQLLMDANYESTTKKMDLKHLRDEIVTMVIVGYDTTANSLSWTLYQLSKHPKILQQLMKEINTILGDKSPTVEELPLLKYTEQVINESLRMYPTAWATSRKAIKPDQWDNVSIHPGDVIYCNIYTLHHSEEYYDQPSVFNPDRFAAENEEEVSKKAYLPFGSGPRSCIGSNFSLMEMKLVLVGLLQRFSIHLEEDAEVEMAPLLTLSPKYGIKMKLHSRTENK